MSSRAQKSQLIWIVSGPSGSGKTTLCEALLQEDYWQKRLKRSISCTTRPARPGEQEGKDYYFISDKRFLALKKKNAFLEQEKIFGFYYGTPKKAILDAKRLDRDALLCIDVKGARVVKKALKKNTVSVFVMAPGLNALVERLRKRSTENKKNIEKRIRRVKMELSYASDYDYVIINDNFKEALNKIKAVLTAKRCEGEHVLHSIGKIDR